MQQKLYKVKDVAEMLSVAAPTVRSYTNSGDLEYSTTPRGHRIFTQEQVDNFLRKIGREDQVAAAETVAWVHYTRSSNGDKKLNETQAALLGESYPTPVRVIYDKGSGLNENRVGYKQLLRMVKAREITDVAITNEDRLSRFGFSYIRELFLAYDVTIHVLDPKELKAPEEELMQDFMSLLASFSGKFYRLRGWENQRKLLSKASEVIEERAVTDGEKTSRQ